MARTVLTERKRLNLQGRATHFWTLVPGLNPTRWHRLRSLPKYRGCSAKHILKAEKIFAAPMTQKEYAERRIQTEQRRRNKIAAAINALAAVVVPQCSPQKKITEAALLRAAVELARTLQNTETRLRAKLAALKMPSV